MVVQITGFGPSSPEHGDPAQDPRAPESNYGPLFFRSLQKHLPSDKAFVEAGTGKTTTHTDTYRGRFVKLVPNEEVVQSRR